MKDSKNIMYSLKRVFPIFLIVIFSIAFVYLLISVPRHTPLYFSEKDAEINAVYYIAAFFISMILLWIAYSNLKTLNSEIQGSFLLEIDKRFGNEQNIKAKIIIHEIYLKIKKNKAISCESHIAGVGKNIINLSEDETKADEFIHILCFLNFLETIGFFITEDMLS